MASKETFDAEAFFSARYYDRRYGRYAVQRQGAWRHYVSEGERRGFCPVGYFSPDWWTATYSLDAGECETSFENYLRHHLDKAPSDLYASMSSACFEDGEEHTGIARSRNGLIDFEFINSQNKAVVSAPNALCVYLRLVGDGHQVSPTPYFDPAFYREQYPDIAAWVDPFHHYITHGVFEGRRPAAYVRPKFDFDRFDDKIAVLRDIYSPSELFDIEHPFELTRGDIASMWRIGGPQISQNHFLGEPHIEGADDFDRMLPVFLAYREASK